MSDIFGTTGDDVLAGTSGADVITAGLGSDSIDAGSGNDTIFDDGGVRTTINGGAGNDIIVFDDRFVGSVNENTLISVAIDAGTDNDRVYLAGIRGGVASVALGAGDDYLQFGYGAEGLNLRMGVQVSLGAGTDRIGFSFRYGDQLRYTLRPSPIVVSDFSAGNSGDVVDLSTLLQGAYNNPGLVTVFPGPNPFASGHLLLVQDGADTIVRLDFDGDHSGTGAIYTRDLLRLVGVTSTSLTAFNFAGYDPHGGGPTATSFNGTSGADLLFAAATGSTIDGQAGDDLIQGGPISDNLTGGDGHDTITGGNGADSLAGGNGNDSITGGEGTDTLDGGAGDDVLSDTDNGDDRLIGGGGNDTITVSRPVTNTYFAVAAAHLDTITIFGGDGDDTVSIRVDGYPFFGVGGASTYRVLFNADLGAGNDHFYIGNFAVSGNLTLGAGTDTVEIGGPSNASNASLLPFTISDFAAGDGGDRLDIAKLLTFGNGWAQGTNPFAGGYIRLEATGGGVQVSWDYDGAGSDPYIYPLVYLAGVSLGSLTAFNFSGYAPNLSAPAVQILTGSGLNDRLDGSNAPDQISGLGGNDSLTGGFGNDTLDGGDGNDTLLGGYDTDSVAGGAGDDTLSDTGNGSDTLSGGDGNDVIALYHSYTPTPEVVTVLGGIGDDRADIYSSSAAVIDMGAGNDRVLLRTISDAGTTITLGSGLDIVSLDIGLVSQSRGPLTITDFQTGNGGDLFDVAAFVASFDSAPTLAQANAGERDILYNYFSTGRARLLQSGADTLLQINAFPQNFNDATFSTIATFQNTTAASFTFANLGIEPFQLTAPSTSGDDVFGGTAGNDVVRSLAGNDQLSGLGGDDLLDGGSGNDTISGGDGSDILFGRAGANSISGGSGDDVIYASEGNDSVDGGSGNDILQVDWADQVAGGDDNDVITVDFAYYQTILNSGLPIGSVSAGAGNDLVVTHNANDAAYANMPFNIDLGAGDDRVVLDGTPGALTLGAGTDRVVFTLFPQSELIITDFQPGDGGDIFDSTAYLDDPNSPFASGYLQLTQSGNDVLLTAGGGNLYVHGPLQVRFQNTTVAQFTAFNFDGLSLTQNWVPQVVVSSNLTIAAGQTLNLVNPLGPFGERFGFMYNSPDGLAQFVNHGTVDISVSPPAGSGGGFERSDFTTVTDQSLFHNAADGQFTVHGEAASLIGFRGRSAFIRFVNDGAYTVAYEGAFYPFETRTVIGILDDSYGPGTIVNTGTMTVTGGSDTYGMSLYGGLIVDNRGTIAVSGPEFAVGIRLYSASGEQLNNQGTITATTPLSSPYYSIGVLWEAAAGASSIIRNSGSITADIALYALDFSINGVSDQVINSGQIHGAVLLQDGNDILTNTGTMDGHTQLGSGNDIYNGAGGAHHGSVEGGPGDDSITGGAGAEELYGDGGNDTIAAGGGDDYVDGGTGNNVLDGGDGIDMLSYYESSLGVVADLAAGTVTTSLGSDTVQGFESFFGSRTVDTIRGSGGGELLAGWLGNDTIDGRGGDDTIWGGGGNDLLTGGTGADHFVFDAGDGKDTITDFSTGDRIEIYGYSGYQSLIQSGADLRIVLSATDSLLVRSATAGTFNGANLLFAGSVSGIAIPAPPAATLFPTSDLVIDAGTIFNIGDTQAVRIRYSTIQSTAIALEAPVGVAGLGVYNAGTLQFRSTANTPTTEAIASSIAQGYGGRDHWLVNGATGSILVNAQHGKAIAANGLMSVWNYGAISVTATAGDASGILSPYTMAYSLIPGTVVNAGSLTVTASGAARGIDIANNTVSVELEVNSGSIVVHGGLESHGIENDMNAHPLLVQPKLVNSGTITVTDGTAALDSAGLYLNIASLAQVWNSGTITADYAVKVVQLSSYTTVLTYNLSLYNSGYLNGRVQMSAYDDLLVNTGTINGDVQMGNGNDTFDGRGGQLNGILDGYDGDDLLLTDAGGQQIYGGFGNDTVSGGAGADTLNGGGGIDSFRFGSGFGSDTIADFEVGTSHDFIDVSGYAAFQSMVQQGADVLITFSASDSLLVRNVTVGDLSGAVRFGAATIAGHTIPAAPTAIAPPTKDGFDPFASIPVFQGTSSNDDISGSSAADQLNGLDGNDTLDGGAGADTMIGGTGNDTYVVDSLSDVVTESTGEGTDAVRTGIGSYAGDLNLATIYYLADNVENLEMTGGAGQVVAGNTLNNLITGTANNDVFVMGDPFAPDTSTVAGADTINAGIGSDYMFFARTFDAADQVDGGSGFDVVGLLGTYSITLGANTLSNVEQLAAYSSGNAAAPNNYTLTMHDGNVAAGQLLFITSASLLSNEHLNFNGSAETNGRYLIYGGHGSDTIVGGAGNDRIIGGEGADSLTGGAGNDAFQFNLKTDSTPAARDTITDFTTGDKIDFYFLDANDNAGGSQRFSFIGTAAFGSVAGQLRVADQGAGNWLVEGDTNGDGLADFSLAVVSDHALGAGDFNL